MNTPYPSARTGSPAALRRSRFILSRRLIRSLALTAALFPALAAGADREWKNIEGNTDWNTADNWATDRPNASDAANFSDAAIANPNLSESTTISKIRFRRADAGKGYESGTGYGISGNPGTSLTLMSTAAQGTIEAQNQSGTNTISVNLILGMAASEENLPLFVQSSGGTLILSGNISSTHAITELVISNQGTLILSGENSYAGSTRLGGGVNGTTHINHASALSAGTINIIGTTLANSSGAAITLAHNNNISQTGQFVFTSAAGTGDLSIGTGRLTLTNSSRAVVVTNAGSTLTLGSVDAGGTNATTYQLTVGSNTSAGKLAITGAAGGSLEGNVLLAGGVLEIGHKDALGKGALQWQSHTSSPGTAVFQASVDLTGANAIANEVILGSSGNPVGTAIIGGAHSIEFSGTFTNNGNHRTLTVNNTGKTLFSGENFYLSSGTAGLNLTLDGSGDVVIKGVIANNVSNGNNARLIYAGTGTLTLEGDNIYRNTSANAATTVSSGRLLVNGSIAEGDVSVAAGATIGGKGSVGGATVIDGTLSPGNSAGEITFADLSLNSGSIYHYEGGDHTIATGILTLNDNWTLSLSGSNFVDGGSTVLFTFGTLAANPDLDPLIDLTHLGITVSGPLFITQVDNTLVLNGITGFAPVPEPSTVGLLLGSTAAMLLFLRRRRRLR